MKVEKLSATPQLPLLPCAQNTLLTIGNFDGCHLGHQQLIQTTVALAAQIGATPSAMIFSPPPAHYFSTIAPPRLFTPAQQLRAFHELGIQTLFIQEFNAAFASLPYQNFYERIRDQLGLAGIVVGEDFCFGEKRLGNTKKLQALTNKDHLQFSTSPCCISDSKKISSSSIRDLLEKTHDIEKVQALLGRPYLIEGTAQAVFTSNTVQIQPKAQLCPKPGTYRGTYWWGTAHQSPSVMHPDPTLSACAVHISPAGMLEVEIKDIPLPAPFPAKWGLYLCSAV